MASQSAKATRAIEDRVHETFMLASEILGHVRLRRDFDRIEDMFLLIGVLQLRGNKPSLPLEDAITSIRRVLREIREWKDDSEYKWWYTGDEDEDLDDE